MCIKLQDLAISTMNQRNDSKETRILGLFVQMTDQGLRIDHEAHLSKMSKMRIKHAEMPPYLGIRLFNMLDIALACFHTQAPIVTDGMKLEWLKSIRKLLWNRLQVATCFLSWSYVNMVTMGLDVFNILIKARKTYGALIIEEDLQHFLTGDTRNKLKEVLKGTLNAEDIYLDQLENQCIIQFFKRHKHFRSYLCISIIIKLIPSQSSKLKN